MVTMGEEIKQQITQSRYIKLANLDVRTQTSPTTCIKHFFSLLLRTCRVNQTVYVGLVGLFMPVVNQFGETRLTYKV